MKIHCPKCNFVSTIDRAKVPPEGIHTKCPKCKHRLFLKLKAVPSPSDAPPKKQETAGAKTQAGSVVQKTDALPRPMKFREEPTASSEALPRRLPPLKTKGPRPSSVRPSETPPPKKPGGRTAALRSRSKPEQPKKADDPLWEGELDLVSVEQELGTNYLKYALVGLVVVAAMVIIAVGLKPGPETKTRQLSGSGPEIQGLKRYNTKLERTQDLRFIRRKVIRRNYTNYTVSLPGKEFRIMKWLLDDCRWECPDLHQVVIMPWKNQMGFDAEVYCYTGVPYKLKYNWISSDLIIDDQACN